MESGKKGSGRAVGGYLESQLLRTTKKETMYQIDSRARIEAQMPIVKRQIQSWVLFIGLTLTQELVLREETNCR
jgi:hypothetical protein